MIFSLVVLGVRLSVAAETVRILPKPREIRVGDRFIPLPPNRSRIVCHSSDVVARNGVDVIQARLKELGVPPLATAAPGGKHDEANVVVHLGTPQRVPFRSANAQKLIPKESQGYAVSVPAPGQDGQTSILLGGRDPTGALYACVTFARLLSVRDGALCVREAQLRDWPDYRIRILHQLRHMVPRWPDHPKQQERAINHAKAFIDREVVAYRLNGIAISSYFFGRDGDDSFIDSVKDPRFSRVKEIIDYGHDRGIKFRYFASSAVGRLDRLKENPRYRGLMELAGRLHTWGDDELLRRRYDAIGRALAHYSIDMVFVHHADTTNENWPNRSDHDRARFGDDRAKADANMMNAYYDAFRRHVPGILVYACVHPYSPDYLDKSKYHHGFFEQLGGLIPEDMGIVLREGRRRNYAELRQYYRGRPFATYHEVYHSIVHKGTICSHNKMFSSCQPRFVKSFYFPHRDACYLNPWNWGKVNTLIAAQYVWNVNTPGASDAFDYKESLAEFDGDCPAVYSDLLPDVIREVYGDAHTDDLTKFYSLPFRPAWLALPMTVKRQSEKYLKSHRVRNASVPDVAGQLETQIEAGKRGVALMDRVLSDEKLPSALRREAVSLRKFSLLFKCLGPAQRAYAKAYLAVEEGEAEKGLAAVSEAKELLRTAAETLKQEGVQGTKWVSCGLVDGRRSSTRWRDAYIDKVYLRRYEELAALARAGGSTAEIVPQDVLKAAAKRSILCVPLAGKIRMDGRIIEDSWKAAQPVRPFIKVGRTRQGKIAYPDAQTEARYLYGEEGIYVGVRCEEDQTDSMAATASRRDDYAVFLDDNVELFFMPDPDGGRYCHLVFNVGGRQLDMLPMRLEDGSLQNDKRWNADWQVKTQVESGKAWTAEVFIPWSTFSTGRFNVMVGGPSAGAKWKAFIGRSRRQLEYSAPVWVESFHETQRYPELRFD